MVKSQKKYTIIKWVEITIEKKVKPSFLVAKIAHPLSLHLLDQKIFYMTKKRFLSAIGKTMVFFAICHLTLLVVLFAISLKLSYLNAFSIIGLQNFIPGIEKGGLSFAISTTISIFIFLVFYVSSKSKK